MLRRFSTVAKATKRNLFHPDELAKNGHRLATEDGAVAAVRLGTVTTFAENLVPGKIRSFASESGHLCERNRRDLASRIW
jgi:hypothetical protein